ncbi:YqaA family protein [Brevibacillus fulvus]|uniref:Membrane protein YqaA with SNARE-associated domain n=1 Tax=Brevibacillus fulvus TaxID=1125967 RepID=A0A938Y1Z7_9BACL|nr:VTT domain-containing protein [Brevibacillus fulvus]MBM7590142.1 membrane protein YqaA with SNARE-associated domain [Brevibacillus fulvus]
MFEQITQIFMQYGVWGLFTLAFLDSFIIPVPPFFLQIAMSLVEPSSALRFSTLAFTGSVLGAPIGFLLGRWLGKPLLRKILPEKWTEKATAIFSKNGDAAVIIGAFTPIPFKVFTILSGVFGYSLVKLMLFAIIGRGVKFYLIGLLFYFYGQQAKDLLDQYLDVGLLAVAAVLFIGWLIWKKRQKT